MRSGKAELFLHPRLMIFPLAQRGFLDFLPDKLFLKMMYRARFSRKLNLKKPESYNECLQYLKIHDRNPRYIELVDKYAVRKHISTTVGEEYLAPMIGIYNNPDEIEWEKLPQQFILKCTHGTHCSIICKDKQSFDINSASDQLKKWLKHNYYYDAREWPYKNVKPRIMIEELITPEQGSELLDIKIMCFAGKPEFIVLHRNITNTEDIHTLNLFTPEWKPIDVEWDCARYTGTIDPPRKLDKILELAKKLSSGYPHMRVDFMINGDHIYFGELTLYPGAGFKPFLPAEFDVQIGKLVKLENTYDKNNG